MNLPELTKQRFLSILKKMPISEYPSLKTDEYLYAIKQKADKGIQLGFTEKAIGFAKLKKYFKQIRDEQNAHYIETIDFTKFSHRPPKKYQEDGAIWLLKHDRCILADDQGLGKTIQVIMAVQSFHEDYKVLIVTKKTLKYNFEKELSFYTDSYTVIEDTWESGYKYTIVHYDSLKKWAEQIVKEEFQIVISDECHVLMNPKSKRSKYFSTILKLNPAIKKLWLLTGTPITNFPINLFPLLKMIQHPLAKNWRRFVERYCNAYIDKRGHWQTKGASNLRELFRNTTDSLLRRLKKDYLPDLPNKYRTPIFIKLNNREGYDRVVSEYQERKLGELQEELEFVKDLVGDASEIDVNEMTELILKRQFCAIEKVRDGSLISLIDDEVADGNKVIIFTNFTEVVDAVYKHYTDGVCRFLDGRITDPKKRLEIIDEFNSDESLRVFVLNLQVGGTGNNIQSANSVIVNDMDWVPGNMLQAEDRAWRFGQLQEVNVRYLLYDNTVEEILYSVVDKKMQTITAAIEGKEEKYFDHNGRVVIKDTTQETKNKILQEIFEKLNDQKRILPAMPRKRNG